MSLFDWFRTDSPAPTVQQADAVSRIVRALEALPEEKARFLAAWAYLLSRVARADLKVSPEEARAIERLIAEHGGLPMEQAMIVAQIARHQQLLFGATEDFLVTREFNKISTRDEKLHLLDCLYAVAAAEDTVSAAEDKEIRQIASELLLEHREIIEVRARYR